MKGGGRSKKKAYRHAGYPSACVSESTCRSDQDFLFNVPPVPERGKRRVSAFRPSCRSGRLHAGSSRVLADSKIAMSLAASLQAHCFRNRPTVRGWRMWRASMPLRIWLETLPKTACCLRKIAQIIVKYKPKKEVKNSSKCQESELHRSRPAV